MKRLFFSIIFLFLLVIPALGQNIKVAGIASKGGKIVRTSSMVQHTLMETYPSCVVTVYLTGTLTLAPIFSDEIGTAKSNPFTANTDASWYFYVAAGRYDIKFSGFGILTPFTLSDVFVDEGGGGGGGDVESVFGRTGIVVAQTGDYDFNQLDFTGSNFSSIVTRSASDLNAGTLPNSVFPLTLPALNGSLLTNLNAANLTGTIDDARLSANVPLKNTANTFSLNNLFNASVGIGTLTPDRKLEILDGSAAQMRLTAVDGSAFTDLFTDSGGTFNILPSGIVAFDTVGNQVNPLNNFSENLGQINKKWLTLHAAELFVETIVAQNTVATIGGRIIVAPSNILIQDLSPAGTTIFVKYNNFGVGDTIYMEGNSSVEFMAITSGASIVSGGFSYTVTRNLDGTGANNWFAGDALVNSGIPGEGFIDIYSLRGVKSATQIGPTIVGNVRNSTTFNDWTENWAIGNLRGIYGYGSDITGVALGAYDAAKNHITVDANNGIRIFEGLSTVVSSWNLTGITLGQTTINQPNVKVSSSAIILSTGSNERTRLNADGSGFVANSLVSWNSAGTFSVTGNASIGGWSIGSGVISSTGININSGASAGLAFGTVPPTSASAGTGIWLDRTGLYGLSSNVVQAKFDATNGKFIAGANAVVLDVNGLVITQSLAGSVNTKVKWTDSGVDSLKIGAFNGDAFIAVQGGSSGGIAPAGRLLFSVADNTIANQLAVNYVADATAGIGINIWPTIGGANFKGIVIADTVGGSAFTASTILKLDSTTGAFIPPKMTTTQKNALTPTDGMMLYDTTLNKLQVRAAGAWVDLH